LSKYDYYGNGRDAKNEDEAGPIFYKRDKFYPIESGMFWLSETPDIPGSILKKAYLPRIVSWIKLK